MVMAQALQPCKDLSRSRSTMHDLATPDHEASAETTQSLVTTQVPRPAQIYSCLYFLRASRPSARVLQKDLSSFHSLTPLSEGSSKGVFSQPNSISRVVRFPMISSSSIGYDSTLSMAATSGHQPDKHGGRQMMSGSLHSSERKTKVPDSNGKTFFRSKAVSV